MKLFLKIILIVLFVVPASTKSQDFPKNPQEVAFVTSDIKNFWVAFDSIDISSKNPFNRYVKNGSLGVQGFIPNRIMNADSLLSMVRIKSADYEKNRAIEPLIRAKVKEIKPSFYALEYWYPDAVYPPVYFVVGRFNSGGTTSDNGLIIGVEKLNGLDYLEELIIHESIHYQQKWPDDGNTTLLQQSVLEGSADFIAELVTGMHGNKEANDYGNKHKTQLCKEFVELMQGDRYTDWLYGVSDKDDRPNDLGYWIGYEIVKAYFEKFENKKEAVHDILNIEDYNYFLSKSEYLSSYMN